MIKAAHQCGPFYLLQDYQRENGKTDVSIIKSIDGKIEFYKENEGKIWMVDRDVRLITNTGKSFLKHKIGPCIAR